MTSYSLWCLNILDIAFKLTLQWLDVNITFNFAITIDITTNVDILIKNLHYNHYRHYNNNRYYNNWRNIK